MHKIVKWSRYLQEIGSVPPGCVRIPVSVSAIVGGGWAQTTRDKQTSLPQSLPNTRDFCPVWGRRRRRNYRRLPFALSFVRSFVRSRPCRVSLSCRPEFIAGLAGKPPWGRAKGGKHKHRKQRKERTNMATEGDGQALVDLGEMRDDGSAPKVRQRRFCFRQGQRSPTRML